jgi:hypothetical protein
MSQAHYSTTVQKTELFLSDLQLDRVREELIHTDQELKTVLARLGINIDTDRAKTLLELDGFYQCSICEFWNEASNISNLEKQICIECSMVIWEEE